MPMSDERLEQLLAALDAEADRGRQGGVDEGDARMAGVAPAASAARPPPPAQMEGVPQGRHRLRRTPLLSLPSSLHEARLGVGAPVVRGMVVLLIVLGALLGVRVAWAERSAAPRPVQSAEQPDRAAATAPAQSEVGGQQALPSGATVEPSGDPTTVPTAYVEIVVHVIGAVHEPGVVSLAPGSRVQDAVEAAGGLRDEADLTRLNLARPAVDGERLWVPVPGEEPPPELPAPPEPVAVPGSGSADAIGRASDTHQTVVDLNTADQAELETLPGVGPVTAERILAWRAEHGTFATVEELMEVSGIGERTLEQLRPHVGLGP